MKIAVYAITKNEEQFIPRWAQSCMDADLRLIVDTGSTDRTIEIAQSSGCTVASISISPWRFDDARNAALALIPSDFDYCIALDADEVLQPGWRSELERVEQGVTRPRYKYVWSWNADGSEGLTYMGDKIHARKGYRWRHPVHEVITPIDGEKQGNVGLQIHHHPDHSKSRSQYLPLLELAVREDPNDDRNQFYLGREYMFNNRTEDAQRHLAKHLELSTWKAERATAMRFLSRVTDDTEHWLLRACAEAPSRREPWVELAQFYYNRKAWTSCLAAAERALTISNKPLEYLCEAASWGSQPHDLASIAAWNMGLKDRSVDHSINAYSKEPSNQRLVDNLSLVLSLTAKTPVEVIIPTKSNVVGLAESIDSVLANSTLSTIHVVADGDETYQRLIATISDPRVSVTKVDGQPGIHVMWNTAMTRCHAGSHIFFLNDDVVLSGRSLDVMSALLDRDKRIGLLSPNYDSRQFAQPTFDVAHTCRGRYDGTGGIPGFAMMLAADLAAQWRFDETMKWWYGDDDLVHWVVRQVRRGACLTGLATCANNSSWTINNDPPINFAEDVARDKSIFLMKWGG